MRYFKSRKGGKSIKGRKGRKGRKSRKGGAYKGTLENFMERGRSAMTTTMRTSSGSSSGYRELGITSGGAGAYPVPVARGSNGSNAGSVHHKPESNNTESLGLDYAIEHIQEITTPEDYAEMFPQASSVFHKRMRDCMDPKLDQVDQVKAVLCTSSDLASELESILKVARTHRLDTPEQRPELGTAEQRPKLGTPEQIARISADIRLLKNIMRIARHPGVKIDNPELQAALAALRIS